MLILACGSGGDIQESRDGIFVVPCKAILFVASILALTIMVAGSLAIVRRAAGSGGSGTNRVRRLASFSRRSCDSGRAVLSRTTWEAFSRGFRLKRSRMAVAVNLATNVARDVSTIGRGRTARVGHFIVDFWVCCTTDRTAHTT